MLLLKVAYRPREVHGPHGLLPLSRSKLYEMLHTGQLASIRAGRSILIPASAIEAWLKGGTAA
jgi:excisionase family DNA binding protein